MNRNQLMAFTIAYDTRNLVRTADKMYVSQSAISQQLKKLEDELHTELFVHKKGQIVPNEYGDLFYPYAKEALATLSRGEEALRRRQQADRNLVVYLYSYNGNSAISRAIRIFQQTHSDLRLEMRRLSRPGSIHMTEQTLYFACESWIHSPNVHFVPLYQAHYLCVMRKTDVPAGCSCLHLEDIRDQIHYLPPSRGEKNDPLIEEIKAGVPGENLRQSPDFSSSLLNISISGGVCICPDYLFFSQELAGVPYCPERGFTVGFAYLGMPSSAMEEFISCIKAILAECDVMQLPGRE